ncbi:phosphate ABC transporter substrate-binding protein, PhoT family [Alkalispirochaeta americana]|uniref:Phosphate-binding protein n=1 Tax=Alkalispirochaeta americana TaxID=159291 RepID=A0A1N6U5V5_9SPIO|nr:phosphate ABC transporter substrate-binding protein [Alkalispirochaeta americana]SIQ60929.1 phosphate ABC transporter substrate-binding protein, PhoT family [Alkalispirochaeta americana]
MKNARTVAFIAAMALLVPAFSFAGGRSEAGGPAHYTIEVTGSTSVSPLMERFAETYSAAHPQVTINVSGTGSGDGITGANTGVAELGMSSRSLRPTELGFGLDVLTVAIDAIAAVVHPDNPVSDLTRDQLRQIYTGEITNWNQVGGPDRSIAVVSREPGSGTRGAFEEVLGFVDLLVAGAIEFDGTGGVRASVAGNPNAIGYISLGSITDEVKTLDIDGVPATGANVASGTYTIARPFLVLYRQEKIASETDRFLEWMVSPEAQAIVERNYVRVN